MENYKGYIIEYNDCKQSEYPQFNFVFYNMDFDEKNRFGETIEECKEQIDFIIEENKL